MPAKNGGLVCKEIQEYYDMQAELFPDTTIEDPIMVLLTAYATPTIKKYAKQIGIHRTYAKPMQFEELKQLVEQSLKWKAVCVIYKF